MTRFFTLLPLLAAAVACVSAVNHGGYKARDHQAIIGRKDGFQVRHMARDVNDPQPGDATKAIPAPKIIPECNKMCVYITAPSDVAVLAEVQGKNFTVDSNTVAYQLGYGQANTYGFQPTSDSTYGITVAYEKLQNMILMVQNGPAPNHTLIARYESHTRAWVGPAGFGPYSNVGSEPNSTDNVFILYV
ncbi:hypothetical protein OC844_003844 [Tilletia horrida]|nr:hypothetical protein OC844_003844 [Tilletia horrida]